MANANNPYGFAPYKASGGGAFTLENGLLAGTVSVGDALMRSSGDLVIHDGGAGKVVGVAAMAGVSGDTIDYYPVEGGNQVWKAQMVTGTTYTKAIYGAGYGIGGTTGVQYVDYADTTDKIVRVIKSLPSSPIGANAEVLVVFVNGERWVA